MQNTVSIYLVELLNIINFKFPHYTNYVYIMFLTLAYWLFVLSYKY